MQCLQYIEGHTMWISPKTEFKWKLSINVMKDSQRRDQYAFISISRSMITSPWESILRRLYWKMDRNAVTHYQSTNHMIKSNDVENVSRWYQSRVPSMLLCVTVAGFTFHILPITKTFNALQTHISSYGFYIFHSAVCVIFLYKVQWASALTVSSGRCSNNNVRQQIFANALFRSKIEAFRVASTLLTCSSQLFCYHILQLVCAMDVQVVGVSSTLTV